MKRDSGMIDMTLSKESLPSNTRESSSNLPSFRVPRDSGNLTKNPSAGMSPSKQPVKKLQSTKTLKLNAGFHKGSTSFQSSIM